MTEKRQEIPEVDVRIIHHGDDLEWAANELEELALGLRNGKQINVCDAHTRRKHLRVLRGISKEAAEAVMSVGAALEKSFAE